MGVMDNPEFVVFCGSMFSSKTTQLLLAIEHYRYQKKTLLVFKPAMDERYSISDIVSHGGWRHEAISIETGQDILDWIAESDEVVHAVALDEAFMVPGSADALIWLFKQGVSILVASLDISATGKVFDEVREVLPWATRVVKCSAVCTVCGSDAYYTHRRGEYVGEIQVGGDETYEPRCFTHHIVVNERDK